MTVRPFIRDLSLAADLDAMRRNDHTLRQHIDKLHERFAAIEPHIDAWLPEPGRFERLRADAARLETQYPDPTKRPPLFGALLGVKDIFHADGFVTRAGASLPPDCFAGEQAEAVTRLKRAGALIVGKTVTTEFAYFEPGPTRNPHNPAHTPGGSSSGSAAAVAAGLAHLATGTQTVGSVIRPAAYCGIVGFKPSFDRVPTGGLVPFSKSADHVGFFTQDVDSMRLAAPAVINDWRSATVIQERPVLAVPEGAYLQQSTALDVFEAQLYVLQGAGYIVKRVDLLDDIAAIDAWHLDLISAELAQAHREWYPQYRGRYRPRTAALIEYGLTVSADRLAAARVNQLAFRERLHGMMDGEGIDIVVSPAAPDVAPPGIAATGSPMMNMPWTHAGIPALSLPAGLGSLGMPLGLQLVARFGADEELLRWAAEMEPLFGG